MSAIPQAMLTEASRYGLSQDIKILQGYRLAPTDATHVDRLLDFMAPKRGTLWADIGCGFGEVARLMQARRPDLDFVLVNNNAFQLAVAPSGFQKLQADMHAIPLDDAAVDGCMLLYALCHAEPINRALAEAARITAPGGELFVFDYARLSGDNRLLRQRLFAEAIPFDRMDALAAASGWKVTRLLAPDGDDALFRRLYDNDAEYALIFTHLMPVLWKAVRV